MEYQWIEGCGQGFEQARAIRTEVFVKEQRYTEAGEFDTQDENSLHVVVLENGVPMATARVFETEPGEFHIGRVAVLPAARGKGVGLAMMQQAIEKAREQGANCILLGAQSDKTYFYERLGFHACGGGYLEEGNPHTNMRLDFDAV